MRASWWGVLFVWEGERYLVVSGVIVRGFLIVMRLWVEDFGVLTCPLDFEIGVSGAVVLRFFLGVCSPWPSAIYWYWNRCQYAVRQVNSGHHHEPRHLRPRALVAFAFSG